MTIQRTKEKEIQQSIDPGGDVIDNTSTSLDGQFVHDTDVVSLLGRILKELKIMNIHLSLLTDENITKVEVE